MLSQAARGGTGAAGASLKLPHRWNSVPILSFNMGVTSPRDSASGQASGKRQWKPVVVVKNTDQDSSKLFGALVNNESLDEVVIEFTNPPKSCPYEWITLIDAHIVDITHKVVSGKLRELVTFSFASVEGGRGQSGLELQTYEWERIALTFAKIEISFKNSGKMWSDDWSQRS